VFGQGCYGEEEEIVGPYPQVEELTEEIISELLLQDPWLEISGSIQVPGEVGLTLFEILSLPTFNPVAPSMVAFLIEPSLYRNIYGDYSDFHQEAADRLLKLSVLLGAVDPVDGFQLILVRSLEQIKPFDGEMLRASLVKPTPIRERLQGKGLPHGRVTGIRSSLLPMAEIRKTWTGATVFETPNGFCILNLL
jgi:hypothetical protein